MWHVLSGDTTITWFTYADRNALFLLCRSEYVLRATIYKDNHIWLIACWFIMQGLYIHVIILLSLPLVITFVYVIGIKIAHFLPLNIGPLLDKHFPIYIILKIFTGKNWQSIARVCVPDLPNSTECTLPWISYISQYGNIQLLWKSKIHFAFNRSIS